MVRPSARSTARLSHGAAAPDGGSTLGPMGRWREAATDALAHLRGRPACSCWRPLLCAADAGARVPHDRGTRASTSPSRAAATTLRAARRSRPSCRAFFPLQPLAWRASPGRPGSRRPGAARRWRRSRALARADPAAPPLQRAARPPHGAARLRRRRVLPVRVRAQHELLGGPLPAGLDRGVQRRRARGSPALALPRRRRRRTRRGRRRSRSRSASAARRVRSRRSGGAPRSRGPSGAVAGVGHRVRGPAPPPRRLAGEPARAATRAGDRSTSVVDAPGELARYVWDAITLGHAQNLLYLTARAAGGRAADRAVAAAASATACSPTR